MAISRENFEEHLVRYQSLPIENIKNDRNTFAEKLAALAPLAFYGFYTSINPSFIKDHSYYLDHTVEDQTIEIQSIQQALVTRVRGMSPLCFYAFNGALEKKEYSEVLRIAGMANEAIEAEWDGLYNDPARICSLAIKTYETIQTLGKEKGKKGKILILPMHVVQDVDAVNKHIGKPGQFHIQAEIDSRLLADKYPGQTHTELLLYMNGGFNIENDPFHADVRAKGIPLANLDPEQTDLPVIPLPEDRMRRIKDFLYGDASDNTQEESLAVYIYCANVQGDQYERLGAAFRAAPIAKLLRDLGVLNGNRFKFLQLNVVACDIGTIEFLDIFSQRIQGKVAEDFANAVKALSGPVSDAHAEEIVTLLRSKDDRAIPWAIKKNALQDRADKIAARKKEKGVTAAIEAEEAIVAAERTTLDDAINALLPAENGRIDAEEQQLVKLVARGTFFSLLQIRFPNYPVWQQEILGNKIYKMHRDKGTLFSWQEMSAVQRAAYKSVFYLLPDNSWLRTKGRTSDQDLEKWIHELQIWRALLADLSDLPKDQVEISGKQAWTLWAHDIRQGGIRGKVIALDERRRTVVRLDADGKPYRKGEGKILIGRIPAQNFPEGSGGVGQLFEMPNGFNQHGGRVTLIGDSIPPISTVSSKVQAAAAAKLPENVTEEYLAARMKTEKSFIDIRRIGKDQDSWDKTDLISTIVQVRREYQQELPQFSVVDFDDEKVLLWQRFPNTYPEKCVLELYRSEFPEAFNNLHKNRLFIVNAIVDSEGKSALQCDRLPHYQEGGQANQVVGMLREKRRQEAAERLPQKQQAEWHALKQAIPDALNVLSEWLQHLDRLADAADDPEITALRQMLAVSIETVQRQKENLENPHDAHVLWYAKKAIRQEITSYLTHEVMNRLRDMSRPTSTGPVFPEQRLSRSFETRLAEFEKDVLRDRDLAEIQNAAQREGMTTKRYILTIANRGITSLADEGIGTTDPDEEGRIRFWPRLLGPTDNRKIFALKRYGLVEASLPLPGGVNRNGNDETEKTVFTLLLNKTDSGEIQDAHLPIQENSELDRKFGAPLKPLFITPNEINEGAIVSHPEVRIIGPGDQLTFSDTEIAALKAGKKLYYLVDKWGYLRIGDNDLLLGAGEKGRIGGEILHATHEGKDIFYITNCSRYSRYDNEREYQQLKNVLGLFWSAGLQKVITQARWFQCENGRFKEIGAKPYQPLMLPTVHWTITEERGVALHSGPGLEERISKLDMEAAHAAVKNDSLFDDGGRRYKACLDATISSFNIEEFLRYLLVLNRAIEDLGSDEVSSFIGDHEKNTLFKKSKAALQKAVVHYIESVHDKVLSSGVAASKKIEWWLLLSSYSRNLEDGKQFHSKIAEGIITVPINELSSVDQASIVALAKTIGEYAVDDTCRRSLNHVANYLLSRHIEISRLDSDTVASLIRAFEKLRPYKKQSAENTGAAEQVLESLKELNEAYRVEKALDSLHSLRLEDANKYLLIARFFEKEGIATAVSFLEKAKAQTLINSDDVLPLCNALADNPKCRAKIGSFYQQDFDAATKDLRDTVMAVNTAVGISKENGKNYWKKIVQYAAEKKANGASADIAWDKYVSEIVQSHRSYIAAIGRAYATLVVGNRSPALKGKEQLAHLDTVRRTWIDIKQKELSDVERDTVVSLTQRLLLEKLALEEAKAVPQQGEAGEQVDVVVGEKSGKKKKKKKKKKGEEEKDTTSLHAVTKIDGDFVRLNELLDWHAGTLSKKDELFANQIVAAREIAETLRLKTHREWIALFVEAEKKKIKQIDGYRNHLQKNIAPERAEMFLSMVRVVISLESNFGSDVSNVSRILPKFVGIASCSQEESDWISALHIFYSARNALYGEVMPAEPAQAVQRILANKAEHEEAERYVYGRSLFSDIITKRLIPVVVRGFIQQIKAEAYHLPDVHWGNVVSIKNAIGGNELISKFLSADERWIEYLSKEIPDQNIRVAVNHLRDTAKKITKPLPSQYLSLYWEVIKDSLHEKVSDEYDLATSIRKRASEAVSGESQLETFSGIQDAIRIGSLEILSQISTLTEMQTYLSVVTDSAEPADKAKKVCEKLDHAVEMQTAEINDAISVLAVPIGQVPNDLMFILRESINELIRTRDTRLTQSDVTQQLDALQQKLSDRSFSPEDANRIRFIVKYYGENEIAAPDDFEIARQYVLSVFQSKKAALDSIVRIPSNTNPSFIVGNPSDPQVTEFITSIESFTTRAKNHIEAEQQLFYFLHEKSDDEWESLLAAHSGRLLEIANSELANDVALLDRLPAERAKELLLMIDRFFENQSYDEFNQLPFNEREWTKIISAYYDGNPYENGGVPIDVNVAIRTIKENPDKHREVIKRQIAGDWVKLFIRKEQVSNFARNLQRLIEGRRQADAPNASTFLNNLAVYIASTEKIDSHNREQFIEQLADCRHFSAWLENTDSGMQAGIKLAAEMKRHLSIENADIYFRVIKELSDAEDRALHPHVLASLNQQLSRSPTAEELHTINVMQHFLRQYPEVKINPNLSDIKDVQNELSALLLNLSARDAIKNAFRELNTQFNAAINDLRETVMPILKQQLSPTTEDHCTIVALAAAEAVEVMQNHTAAGREFESVVAEMHSGLKNAGITNKSDLDIIFQIFRCYADPDIKFPDTLEDAHSEAIETASSNELLLSQFAATIAYPRHDRELTVDTQSSELLDEIDSFVESFVAWEFKKDNDFLSALPEIIDILKTKPADLDDAFLAEDMVKHAKWRSHLDSKTWKGSGEALSNDAKLKWAVPLSSTNNEAFFSAFQQFAINKSIKPSSLFSTGEWRNKASIEEQNCIKAMEEFVEAEDESIPFNIKNMEGLRRHLETRSTMSSLIDATAAALEDFNDAVDGARQELLSIVAPLSILFGAKAQKIEHQIHQRIVALRDSTSSGDERFNDLQSLGLDDDETKRLYHIAAFFRRHPNKKIPSKLEDMRFEVVTGIGNELDSLDYATTQHHTQEEKLLLPDSEFIDDSMASDPAEKLAFWLVELQRPEGGGVELSALLKMLDVKEALRANGDIAEQVARTKLWADSNVMPEIELGPLAEPFEMAVFPSTLWEDAIKRFIGAKDRKIATLTLGTVVELITGQISDEDRRRISRIQEYFTHNPDDRLPSNIDDVEGIRRFVVARISNEYLIKEAREALAQFDEAITKQTNESFRQFDETIADDEIAKAIASAISREKIPEETSPTSEAPFPERLASGIGRNELTYYLHLIKFVRERSEAEVNELVRALAANSEWRDEYPAVFQAITGEKIDEEIKAFEDKIALIKGAVALPSQLEASFDKNIRRFLDEHIEEESLQKRADAIQRARILLTRIALPENLIPGVLSVVSQLLVNQISYPNNFGDARRMVLDQLEYNLRAIKPTSQDDLLTATKSLFKKLQQPTTQKGLRTHILSHTKKQSALSRSKSDEYFKKAKQATERTNVAGRDINRLYGEFTLWSGATVASLREAVAGIKFHRYFIEEASLRPGFRSEEVLYSETMGHCAGHLMDCLNNDFAKAMNSIELLCGLANGLVSLLPNEEFKKISRELTRHKDYLQAFFEYGKRYLDRLEKSILERRFVTLDEEMDGKIEYVQDVIHTGTPKEQIEKPFYV